VLLVVAMNGRGLALVLAGLVSCSAPAAEEASPTQPTTDDPDWAIGMRMVDVVFRETFPTSADEVTYDPAYVRTLIDEAWAAHATTVQLHFSREYFYADWIDDEGFAKNMRALGDATAHAHARGLRVLVYMNGLEVMTPGANPSGERQGWSDARPSIRRDHPSWLQRTPSGNPIWFSGVPQTAVDYLQGSDWEDAWLCPLSGYRALFLSRARAVMAAGSDGLFIDVANLPGNGGLVPEFLGEPESHAHVAGCYDDHCTTAFEAAEPGFRAPAAAQHLAWNDEGWQRWIRFRYRIVRDYLADIERVAREVNSDARVLAENSENDVANDTIDFGQDTTQSPVGVTPELTSVLPESGACSTSPADYAALFARVKHGQAVNRMHGRAFVPLGLAIEPEDAAMQFGILASASGAYFTFGRETRDLAAPFAFLETNGRGAVGKSLARVAVFQSTFTRDFIDRNEGTIADAESAAHLGAYRRVVATLVDAHIPFDVVIQDERGTPALASYDVVVLPDARCMTNDDVGSLGDARRVVAIGESATRDRWCRAEPKPLPARLDVRLDGSFEESLLSAVAIAEPVVVVEGAHGLASAAPIIVDAYAGSEDLSVHLINLAPAVAGTCGPRIPMSPRPIADVTLSFGCDVVDCSAARASFAGYPTPSSATATRSDNRLAVTIARLPSYGILRVGAAAH
jgi:hypothetical protein